MFTKQVEVYNYPFIVVFQNFSQVLFSNHRRFYYFFFCKDHAKNHMPLQVL